MTASCVVAGSGASPAEAWLARAQSRSTTSPDIPRYAIEHAAYDGTRMSRASLRRVRDTGCNRTGQSFERIVRCVGEDSTPTQRLWVPMFIEATATFTTR